jgi:hypothetical protein
MDKGRKYSTFDVHGQFLPLDHPFRQDMKNFTKGIVVESEAPHKMTGPKVRAQLDALQL